MREQGAHPREQARADPNDGGGHREPCGSAGGATDAARAPRDGSPRNMWVGSGSGDAGGAAACERVNRSERAAEGRRSERRQKCAAGGVQPNVFYSINEVLPTCPHLSSPPPSAPPLRASPRRPPRRSPPPPRGRAARRARAAPPPPPPRARRRGRGRSCRPRWGQTHRQHPAPRRRAPRRGDVGLKCELSASGVNTASATKRTYCARRRRRAAAPRSPSTAGVHPPRSRQQQTPRLVDPPRQPRRPPPTPAARPPSPPATTTAPPPPPSAPHPRRRRRPAGSIASPR